jgi:signal transduction histidine kinase/CheY-like chemotaxis protein
MSGERVLVIEDGKAMRDFLVDSILVPAGYRVLVAPDGALGLRKAQQELPDLIILDMQMPLMTGTQVMQALRDSGHGDIPVIMMTAEGSETVAVAAFRLGARDYIVKPFTHDEMLSTVQRVLADEKRRRESDKNVQRIMLLNKQLERQLQEINTLYSIGKSVTSLLDVGQVLNRVVEAAVYLAQAEEGLLLLVDEQSGELYVRAAKNIDDQVAHQLRLRAADSLAGQVLRTGEPVIVGGEQQKIKTAYLVKAILYVPLKVKGRVIGVLGVDNQQVDRIFQQRDQRLLAALADYAAIAIENARLYSATEAEKSKFEAILRETADAVLVVDERERLMLYNTAAAQDFGITGDAAGRPLAEVIQNPAVIELFNRAPVDGRHQRAEVPLGEGRTLNAHLATIPGVGRAVVLQDITHLKELDRIKSEFVSTVSHDLRSPLTAILGYVDLLARVGPLNEVQGEFVKRVQHSVRQITDLIGDLLDLGRIEAGLDKEMSTCRFAAITRDALEGLRPKAEGKQQTLVVDIAAGLVPMRGNELRLKQVVSNLVENAIKYTPDGGHVRVEVRDEDGQTIFCVTDDGPGIPLADQPYIFDRFYRSQDVVAHEIPGTGLGLAIVKSIVEGHQGRIWCESPVANGHGTMFTVVLPKNTE